jgi:predicted dehydrogenase
MTGLKPETVSAEMEFYDDERLIDKTASVSVKFENGAIASFADSAVSPTNREHIHIWDDSGGVYLDGKNWNRRRLTLIEHDGSERSPDLAYDEAQTKFGAFVESIQEDTPSQASSEDVFIVTALLEAAYESARTGDSVAVNLDT